MTINLLPPCHKWWMQVFLAFLGVVRHHAAIGDHDLQVFGINPDPAKQITIVLHDFLGRNIEDVAIHLVHFLLAHIRDVVRSNCFGGENKWIAMLDVVHVGGGSCPRA